MKKLFFYAMLILTVVLTGCGKSEEQKIHSMYLNNSTKVAEMETEQAQAMLENRNIDKQKMLKQIKSLIEENEKNITKLSDEKYDEAKAALNILIEEGCSSSIIWFYSYLVRNKIKGIELDNKKLIDPRLDYFFNKAYQTAPFLEKIKLYDYINTCLDRLTILDEVDENYDEIRTVY